MAGFPSLHWFAYGAQRSYGGGRRNETLVKWVTYHARCVTVTAAAHARAGASERARW